jgi:chromosome segregation ATPase
MTEPQELEKTATAYASGAVLCEKQGETEKAVSLYQKATECLNQLMQRFPNYGFTNIYTDRAALYQERVVALQESLIKAEQNKPAPKKPAASEPIEKPKEEARSISIDLTPFSQILQEIKAKLDEISLPRNENVTTVDNTPILQEINGKLDGLSATENKNVAEAQSADLTPDLQEINKKLDEITACISELKNEVGVIKVNVNDIVGKSEHTQKELMELRNLMYSIKYDR